jgi:hypothetical protein
MHKSNWTNLQITIFFVFRADFIVLIFFYSGKQCCIIPVTARTLEEQKEIKDFVSNNMDDTSLMAHLSSSLLSYDGRRQIRGYFVTEPNSTSMIFLFSSIEYNV